MTRYRIQPSQISTLDSLHIKERPLFLDVESEDCPYTLLKQIPEFGFAIVGTRQPQRRSMELLESTLRNLTGQPLVIISGFARGIDSRAHELAVELGFKTIAVLGAGIDVDYPRENHYLRTKILESGGLMISEWEPGTNPYPGNFLKRNRLIAAFSKAVWVVESAALSGSLNTANWAGHLNRELFATPCFPGDIFFQGNQKLLSQSESDRFAVAHPFFGSDSLKPVWPQLSDLNQNSMQNWIAKPKSKLQKWIHDIKGQYGICYLPKLVSHAEQEGIPINIFFRDFQNEIKAKTIIHLSNDEIDFAQSSLNF
jgi:DNA protecting protein DprA